MWGSMPLPLFPIQLKLFSIVLSPTQNWCTHSQILLFNSFMLDFFSFSWGRQIRYHFRIWAALVFRAIKEYCSPTLPMLFYCIEWSFVQQKYLPKTTDAQWSLFSSKAFGLGQTIWADKFWGIWGIFKQFISTHFGTNVCFKKTWTNHSSDSVL